MILLFLETVIIVPAVNTAEQQSIQNENIEQIRQSQEIGSSNRQLNVEKQAENDDEQCLMSPKKVYQNTTQPVNTSDSQRSSKWGSQVNCRTVLYYVAFVGFMVNYMYRININIAIVGMVSVPKAAVANVHTSEIRMSGTSIN